MFGCLFGHNFKKGKDLKIGEGIYLLIKKCARCGKVEHIIAHKLITPIKINGNLVKYLSA